MANHDDKPAWVIESLAIGIPEEQDFSGKRFTTGICKRAVVGPVMLNETGFAGDGVGDRTHHGGPDKAVCVYCSIHYPRWEALLSYQLPSSAFGENLTIADLDESQVHIGDRYQLGEALVEVSQPRQPCAILAARLGRPDFIKRVIDTGWTGFYLRVIETGRVQVGDRLELERADPRAVTVAFASRVRFRERGDQTGVERVLSVPALSVSWREALSRSR